MTKRLRFGIQAGGPAEPTQWRNQARRIEELGYSVLTMADHFDRPLAPFPALAIAAEATTTLRIGTTVLGNDFRHPTVVAKDAATLDVMSSGRFELGIGAGWQTTDYTETGIALDSPGTRIDRLAESVQIIKGLFAAEPCSFDGEHYSIADMTGAPAPAQLGGPPIMMGGGGPRMLRTAARLADIVGINPNLAAGVIDERAGPDATLARTHEKLAWVREAAGEQFDNIEIQVRIHLAAVTDDALGMADALAPALGLTTDEAMASPHALCGTVDEIAAKIQQLRDELGISYFTWGVESAEELAPVVHLLA